MSFISSLHPVTIISNENHFSFSVSPVTFNNCGWMRVSLFVITGHTGSASPQIRRVGSVKLRELFIKLVSPARTGSI